MRPGPEKLIGGALLFVGLGAFGAGAWMLHRIALAGRSLDPGDFAVLGVFAFFGLLCAWVAWQFMHAPSATVAGEAEEGPAQQRRVTISRICAAIGVAMLILCVLVPAHWYPVAFLFGGLVFLAVSHVLTPCVERLQQLKKARQSLRQL